MAPERDPPSALERLVAEGTDEDVKRFFLLLRPPEIADLIENLDDDLRVRVMRLLGAPLASREVTSFLEIYQQAMRMLTRRNMEPQLADADLVLVPEVRGYGTLQFQSMTEIIAHGVAEARSSAIELERLAEPTERAPQAERQPSSCCHARSMSSSAAMTTSPFSSNTASTPAA